jgi:membrane-bound lytic murein transglycosylase B
VSRFPLLLSILLIASFPAAALDSSRDDVQSFIDEMTRTHGFDRDSLLKLFKTVESKKSILDAMSRPAERVTPWHEYRERFVVPRRIAEGAQFWTTHAKRFDAMDDEDLALAVVGILGVETSYGRITGRFRVIDALATLAFDYPPRSSFFRKELQEFLLLTREEAVDPTRVMGSYAGAMGAAQFIPSSYRKFAVDSDGDGKRDLWSSWDDVIGSVANYLVVHGWRKGEPVVVPATVEIDALAKIDTSQLALNETAQSLRAKGVHFEADVADDAPALLVIAEGKNGPEYRVGFTNFYVITRYNRSTKYAMAVHDLGRAVRGSMEGARE